MKLRRTTLFTLSCLLVSFGLLAQGAAPTCSYLPSEAPVIHSLKDLGPSSNKAKKTLYIVPHGSLIERLLGTASALTLAKHRNFNAAVVWKTPDEFKANWSDLFQSPELPLALLPGGNDPQCTLYEVQSHEDFHAIHNNWESINGEKVLCISIKGSILPEDSNTRSHSSALKPVKWFYEMLVPSEAIMTAAKEFQAYQFWDKWGQWLGVHLCFSSDCIASANSNSLTKDVNNMNTAATLPAVEQYIAMAKQLKDLPVDGETVPRFFLVADGSDSASKQARAAMQMELWSWNMTGLKGAAITYPDQFVPLRALEPLEEQLLNLYLLSRMNLIMAPVGSGFAEAAHAMGKSFHLAVRN